MKQYIIIIGLATLIATYITLFSTFMSAYANGNQIMVSINNYGEAQIELILLIITFPMVLFSLYQIAKVGVLHGA